MELCANPKNINIEFIKSTMPMDFIIRYQVIPLKKENSFLYVGMTDIADISLLDLIRFQTNSAIIPICMDEN